MGYHFWDEAIKTAAAAKLLQLCLNLCDPIDSSPPDSLVPGILQARILEWVAISFSNAWKWKVKVKSLSRVHLLATPWTAAHQAFLSMGFSSQEYWSGMPSPSRERDIFLKNSLVVWTISFGLCHHSMEAKLSDKITSADVPGNSSQGIHTFTSFLLKKLVV